MNFLFYSREDLNRLAKTKKIKPHSLKLALYFITLADEDGTVQGHISFNHLHEELGLAVTTINRSFKELKKHSVLLVDYTNKHRPIYSILPSKYWSI